MSEWLKSFHLPILQKHSEKFSFFINILCHVLILLSFLTIFFFKYITHMTEQHINTELKSVIGEQTDKLLQFVTSKDTENEIRWDHVATLSQRVIDEAKKKVPFIEKNNQDLYDESICTLIMFGVGIVLLVAYFLFRGVDLKLKFILLENLIIFAFIGMIEIYFFMNIASQYVPVMPDEAVNSAFSRVKYNLQVS